MDTYNEENPLDAGSTETDPVWDAMIERMHGLVASFFGNYGPEGTEDFIDSKLEEIEEDPGSGEVTGPEDGLIGELHAVNEDYPGGIPIDSAAQTTVYQKVYEFQTTVYELKLASYSESRIKEEFDAALPYLNKAISLLNDTEAMQKYLEIINTTFRVTFLEADGSMPDDYDEDFRNTIAAERGGLQQAVKNIDYYNNRIDQAIANKEPAANIEAYTEKIRSFVDSFAAATGVVSYEQALQEYMAEQAENSSAE